jgi:enamine deaminase RidA (YjgF/YER057c/UK114 family)
MLMNSQKRNQVMPKGFAPRTGPLAQDQSSNPGFAKRNYNYSDWTKGRFSEVVTVVNPGKLIFLAGVGAEDEKGQGGVVRHLGDFEGQCRYAYDKIKRLLTPHGATLGDVVKIVTYVTDIRHQVSAGKCRAEAFGSLPLPVHTLLNVSQLAWTGMLVEIDVTAVTAK